MQDNESSAAEELGLLDLNPDSERLLLFQLPSLLPVPAPSQTPGGSNSPVKPLTQHEACSLHQLPAGKVSHSLRPGPTMHAVMHGAPCCIGATMDVAVLD